MRRMMLVLLVVLMVPLPSAAASDCLTVGDAQTLLAQFPEKAAVIQGLSFDQVAAAAAILGRPLCDPDWKAAHAQFAVASPEAVAALPGVADLAARLEHVFGLFLPQ